MAMEIQLINQIEKHEFLYNFNLAEYNRKDIVEEAWASIAANTNMTVNDCKEKWRNIRSSFLRSMKQSGYKVKKPYYLTEYLRFIIPFLKPVSNVDSTEEASFDAHYTPMNTVNEAVTDFIKVEPDEYGDHDDISTPTDSALLGDLLSSKERTTATRKRRRFIPSNKRLHTEYLRNRNKNATSSSTTGEVTGNNALRMFLLSLMPELETMTRDQVRLFKIKTMTLIDDIKSNSNEIRSNSNSLNNERLQKRLINLLLKNLEQNTRVRIENAENS